MKIETLHTATFNFVADSAEAHAMALAIIKRGAQSSQVEATITQSALPEGADPGTRRSEAIVRSNSIEAVQVFVSCIEDTFDWLGVSIQ